MKKFTFFAGVFAAMALCASAEGLTNRPVASFNIPLNFENNNIKLHECFFNKNYHNIGNTDTNKSYIDLGDVDFGEGDYVACAVDFAQGWGGNDAHVVLSYGDTKESATVFAKVGMSHTWKYEAYHQLAGNFTSVPTGVQHVFLSFEGGAGNLNNLWFFEAPIEDHHLFKLDDAAKGSALRYAYEYDDFAGIRIMSEDAEQLYVTYGDDGKPTPRLDGDSWGWTVDGSVATYGTVDFGKGGWKQVAIEFKHWGTNDNYFLEVYLDEVAEGNRIARIFGGLDLDWVFVNPAKNLEEDITGEHEVFVKWIGGSMNVRSISFAKDEVFVPALEYYGSWPEAYQPAEDAFHMTFTNCEWGQGDPWAYESLTWGQHDGGGNVGWTRNGTILKFLNVDFDANKYNKIAVQYGTGDNHFHNVASRNFSFYVDLEAEGSYSEDQWKENLDEILAGKEPIAVVPQYCTDGWGNWTTTCGEMQVLNGTHDLYMIYNIPTWDNNNGDGANVHNIFMEYDSSVSGIVAPMTESVDKGITEVYTIQGVHVANGASNLAPGLYIVKNGKKVSKVLVK